MTDADRSDGPVIPRFEPADEAGTAVDGGSGGSAADTEGIGSAADGDGPGAVTDGDSPGSAADDAIPIDIADHEDRDRPGEDEREAGSDATDTVTPAAEDDDDGTPPAGEVDDPYPEGVGSPNPEDDQVEPVEVLVGLAEAGGIDPWDIDVVRVTDEFLAAIDEADLRTSGRALFYATVLIRMKSDAMLAPDEPEEPAEPWEQAPAQDAPIDRADPFASLENEMERRLDRKRVRGMPETLDELVRDLREAERDSWWKRSRTYDTSDSPRGFQRGTQELDYRRADDMRMDDEPTAGEVTGATHAEDVDRIIEDVYETLREQYEQGRDEVLYREIATAGGSRVETYLGLLFLAHRGRVRLQQDELFGDLWIQEPGPPSGSEGAVAD